MSTFTRCFFEPTPKVSGIERFDPKGTLELQVSDVANLVESDWNEVHLLVQREFDKLSERLTRRFPVISETIGRTTAPLAFYLFSYRTFEIPGQSAEPVVVGVLFPRDADPERYRVRGDVSGEDTGEIYFEDESRARASLGSRVEVWTAAVQVAKRLCREFETIAGAIWQNNGSP